MQSWFGLLCLRVCLQDVMEDGSVEDQWRKMGGWHAGPGGRAGLWGLLWGWPGLAGIPGVSGLPLCVGGGGILCWFSWWPGCVLVFSGPQMVPVAPAMYACWPLPATAGFSSLSCACDCLCYLPLAGNELASLYVGVIPWPLLGGGIPRWSSALGALRKGERWGALCV